MRRHLELLMVLGVLTAGCEAKAVPLRPTATLMKAATSAPTLTAPAATSPEATRTPRAVVATEAPSPPPDAPTVTPAATLPAGLIFSSPDATWLVRARGQPQLISEEYLPEVSPDQTQILHNRIVPASGPAGDIWLTDLASGITRNLTNTPDKLESEFQWWPANPDLIVFHFRGLDEEFPGSGHLATIRLDGTNYQVLDSDMGSISRAALSHDGQTIAYDRWGDPWLYRLGVGPEPISPEAYGLSFEYGAFPEWSPDDRMLAWKVGGPESGSDGWSAVAVLDLQDKRGYLLHRYSILGGSEIYAQIAWSPDRYWLAVVNQAECICGDNTLWVTRIDGSMQSPAYGASDFPVWGPDSRSLAFWHWPLGAGSYLDSQAMMIDLDEWFPRKLDLPAGARVVDWVTLAPP